MNRVIPIDVLEELSKLTSVIELQSMLDMDLETETIVIKEQVNEPNSNS